jgi:hypothetical protein
MRQGTGRRSDEVQQASLMSGLAPSEVWCRIRDPCNWKVTPTFTCAMPACHLAGIYTVH